MQFGTVLLIILLVIFFFGIAPTLVMSGVIYTVVLVRRSKEKWGRECSIPEDEEYKRMFDIGIEWENRYHDYNKEVEVTNDGLSLKGEYFDFGSNKAVIIIAGRMESCLYAYYFAEPFRKAGYSVLAIDNRAHGLSDGKYVTLGFKESGDILAWGRLLHEKYGVESIVLHGICIGASTSMSVLTRSDCPEYFTKMISEGMYTSFYESFKNHMKEDRHPVFPFALEVMLYVKLFTGSNVVSNGPLKMIDRLDRPILMLQSREDRFSLPGQAQELYDRCKSEKELVWFDKGAHSRIRINATEKYDKVVTDFLNR